MTSLFCFPPRYRPFVEAYRRHLTDEPRRRHFSARATHEGIRFSTRPPSPDDDPFAPGARFGAGGGAGAFGAGGGAAGWISVP